VSVGLLTRDAHLSGFIVCCEWDRKRAPAIPSGYQTEDHGRSNGNPDADLA